MSSKLWKGFRGELRTKAHIVPSMRNYSYEEINIEVFDLTILQTRRIRVYMKLRYLKSKRDMKIQMHVHFLNYRSYVQELETI